MNNTMDAAVELAAGWSVLPLHWPTITGCSCRLGPTCRDSGKHPLTQHGKDDASRDLEVIEEWRRRWPMANLGIRPPDDVVVLDMDPRNGGRSALRELVRRHGRLPVTLTADTGGGGLHIYLRHRGSSRVGKLCAGVDVKSSTGFVVAPPSVHASGRRYRWASGADVSSSFVPVADAPDWVCSLLAPAAPPPRTRGSAAGSGLALVRRVRAECQGNRNNLLHWAACRVAEEFDGLRRQILLAELVEAAVGTGLDRDAAHRTVRSAARTIGRSA